MKKRILVFAGMLIIASSLVYAQVENVAKEVLDAYKNRDVELLRKNASGILHMAITDEYFDDKGIQDDLKAVDNWDGIIREIRYKSGDMMGQTIYLASAHFADVPDNEDELYTVVLSSLDKQKWVMLGSGLVAETKEEFNKMGPSFTENEDAEKEVQEISNNFVLDNAYGEEIDNVSEQDIIDYICNLDSDNFFLILIHEDDFIQAAFSDKGYIIQYMENGEQFEADGCFSQDNTIQIFKKYYSENDNWKDGIDWIKM